MTRKKILVVDDTEFNRELLAQLLEEEYDLVMAEDGAQALEKIEQEQPDLVLMDLGLPVMDGWEATRRIKAQEAHKHIPVIAVTSHAMIGEESKARDAGCDAYLPKPIDEEELFEKIHGFLSK